LVVRTVVAVDVNRAALNADQLCDDGFLVLSERFCDGFKLGFEFGIVVLRGESFRPEEA